MRLFDVIVLSLIFCIFSALLTDSISSLRKMDCRIEQLRSENDSLKFISETFCMTCEGRGFASFEDWKAACGALWNLETIEWKLVQTNSHDEKNGKLMCGLWSGPCGEGQVYYRTNKRMIPGRHHEIQE